MYYVDPVQCIFDITLFLKCFARIITMGWTWTQPPGTLIRGLCMRDPACNKVVM